MPSFQTESIAPDKLLTVAANVLHKSFHDCTRLDAKRRYQALESGREVYLLDLRTEDGGDLKVNLGLERSEFRGKLNFSLFRQLVRTLVAAHAEALRAEQPLPTFADAGGQRWVYLIPAACREGQQLNMLVLAVNTARPGTLMLELMFIDPAQFQQPAAAAG